MLNLHDIAGDVGVSDDTAKRRMKELEKCDTRELPRKNISAKSQRVRRTVFHQG